MRWKPHTGTEYGTLSHELSLTNRLNQLEKLPLLVITGKLPRCLPGGPQQQRIGFKISPRCIIRIAIKTVDAVIIVGGNPPLQLPRCFHQQMGQPLIADRLNQGTKLRVGQRCGIEFILD